MKKNIWRKLLATGLCLIMVCGLAACGKGAENTKEQAGEKADSSDENTKIQMVLDWTPNTNHTGLYVALEKGYFEDAGLDVSIIQPPDDGAVSLVASGKAQFGIDFQDTLAAAFDSDDPMPVTAVAAILQHNTSGIISLKEQGITSPRKLEGKTYATWDSPIEQAVLKNVVTQDGGDFSKVNLVSTTVEDIVAALHADIDAVWIYYGWDGVAASQAGVDTNYFYMKDINPVFDYYSPVLIANNDYLKQHPDEAKAFVAAVSKGYEYAIANPDEAADILLKNVPELDGDLVRESQNWLTDQYRAEADNWGYIDPERWNGFYNWLNENKLVEKDIPENTGFSNDYLTLK